MSCFSIEIIDSVTGVTSDMLNGNHGGVFVDLADDSALTLEATREELNDINEIKIDSIVNVTVPQTPTNNALFFNWFKDGILDRVYDPMCIVLKTGSIPTKQRYVYPVAKNDENCTYELKTTWRKEHWAIALSECALCDAELENNEFELNLQNILNQYSGGLYADGDPIYRWFPAYLGDSMSNNNYLTLQDWRPAFNLLGLTKALLKKVGWCLNAPILECDEYRCLWTYETGEYSNNNVLLDTLKFKACQSSFQVAVDPLDGQESGKILFDDIIGNFIVDSSFEHNGVYTFKFNGNVDVGGVQDSSNEFVRIDIVKMCGTDREVVGSQTVNGTGTQAFFFESGEVVLDSTCSVYLEYTTSADTEFSDICFWNCPIKAVYEDGDIIPMNTLLDCNQNALDRLKGVLHLINGKIDPDCTTKTLNIYPPTNVKCADGTIIKGYNTGETVDISEYIVCNSLITKTPNYDKERYCLYGFKKSSDQAIKDLNLPDGEMPFDYISDLGASYQDKTKEKRNPYFTPTVSVELPQYSSTGIVHLPSIQDNEPRVFNLKFGLQLYEDSNGNNIGSSVAHAGTPLGSLGLTPSAFIDYDSENYTLSSYTDNPSISYETNYKKFYQVEEFQRNGANLQSITICADSVIYNMLKFRKRACFTYNGCSFSLLLDKKTFDVCNYTATLIGGEERKTLDCNNGLGDPTGGGGDPTEDCENYPEVICTENGNCYDLSIGGTLDSGMQNTVWEYRLCDPDTAWTTIPNTSTTTAQLCDLPRTAKVRVQVIFDDDCPNLYAPIKTIDGCNNEPEYIWECYLNSQGQTCFKITLGGTIESPIDTHTYTLLIDGNVVPYTLGDEYCFALSQSGQTIVAQINGDITYTDGCDPNDLEGSKTFPPEEVNCALTNATAICVQDENSCFTFAFEGVVSTDIAIEMYEYECDGVKGYWKPGDDPICCDGELKVKLILIFCHTCPTYCQPTWTICEISCPTGTIETNCVDCILTYTITGYEGYVFNLEAPDGTDLGVVTSGVPITLTQSGDYTLMGTLDNCPDIEDIFTHVMPNAGQGGNSQIDL